MTFTATRQWSTHRGDTTFSQTTEAAQKRKNSTHQRHFLFRCFLVSLSLFRSIYGVLLIELKHRHLLLDRLHFSSLGFSLFAPGKLWKTPKPRSVLPVCAKKCSSRRPPHHACLRAFFSSPPCLFLFRLTTQISVSSFTSAVANHRASTDAALWRHKALAFRPCLSDYLSVSHKQNCISVFCCWLAFRTCSAKHATDDVTSRVAKSEVFG